MPQVHGRNSILHVWDSAGTSRNMTADMSNITLSWTRNNVNSTTMSKETNQRFPGIRDATLTGTAVWNTDTNQVDGIMSALMAASLNTLLRYIPGPCTTGCAFYTGCFLINQWQVQSPLEGMVTAQFAFQISSGSLSASSI